MRLPFLSESKYLDLSFDEKGYRFEADTGSETVTILRSPLKGLKDTFQVIIDDHTGNLYKSIPLNLAGRKFNEDFLQEVSDCISEAYSEIANFDNLSEACHLKERFGLILSNLLERHF